MCVNAKFVLMIVILATEPIVPPLCQMPLRHVTGLHQRARIILGVSYRLRSTMIALQNSLQRTTISIVVLFHIGAPNRMDAIIAFVHMCCTVQLVVARMCLRCLGETEIRDLVASACKSGFVDDTERCRKYSVETAVTSNTAEHTKTIDDGGSDSFCTCCVVTMIVASMILPRVGKRDIHDSVPY